MPELGSSKSLIYLIDFGISQQYINPNDGEHNKIKKESFNGNLIFCSKNMFYEICKLCFFISLAQSRRDDIISLGYLLIFMFNGQVPWIKSKEIPLNS